MSDSAQGAIVRLGEMRGGITRRVKAAGSALQATNRTQEEGSKRASCSRISSGGIVDDNTDNKMYVAARPCTRTAVRAFSPRISCSSLYPCSFTPLTASLLHLHSTSHFQSCSTPSFSVGHTHCFYSSSLSTFPVASSLVRRCCRCSAFASTSNADGSVMTGTETRTPLPLAIVAPKRQVDASSFISLRPPPLFPVLSRSFSSTRWSPTAFRASAGQLQQQGQLLKEFLQLPYVSWRSLLRLVLMLLQDPIRLYVKEPLYLLPVCRRVGLKHFCCLDPLVVAAALLPVLEVHATPKVRSLEAKIYPEEVVVKPEEVGMNTEGASGKRHQERYGKWTHSVNAPSAVHTSLSVLHAKDSTGPCSKEGADTLLTIQAGTPDTTTDSLYAVASPLKEFYTQLDDWHVRGHPFHMHAVQRMLLAVALRSKSYTIQQLLVLIHVLAPLQLLPGVSELLLRKQVCHWQDQMYILQENQHYRKSRKLPPVETLEEREMTVQLLLDHLRARLSVLTCVDNGSSSPVHPQLSQSQQIQQQQRPTKMLQQQQRPQQQQRDMQQQKTEVQQQEMEIGLQQIELQHLQTEKQHQSSTACRHETRVLPFFGNYSSTANVGTGGQQQHQRLLHSNVHTLPFLVEAYEIVSRAALSTAASAAAASCNQLVCPYVKSHMNNRRGKTDLPYDSDIFSEHLADTRAIGGEQLSALPLLSLLSGAEGGERGTEMQLAGLRVSSPPESCSYGDRVFSGNALQSTAAKKISGRDPNNAAAVNTAASTAEVLVWLSSAILRYICDKRNEETDTCELPLALAGTAADKQKLKGIVAVSGIIPSSEIRQQQQQHKTISCVQEKYVSIQQQQDQQQQQKQQHIAVLLAGASQTLMRHTFLSALLQLQEGLFHAMGTAGYSGAAPAVESVTSTATAAAMAGQTLEACGERGRKKAFPLPLMAWCAQTEKAAAATAVSLLYLCSDKAANAATWQQQQQGKREQRQPVVLEEELQREQPVYPEANADTSTAGTQEDKKEGVGSADPAATAKGGISQQREENTADEAAAVLPVLLQVSALQVPEPFCVCIARKLWLTFSKSCSMLSSRGSSTSNSSKRYSRRRRDAMNIGTESKNVCAVDAPINNTSENISSSSISSESENNSSWSQSIFSRVSSSLTSSWWDAATRTPAETAVAASPSPSIPTQGKHSDAALFRRISPQREFSLLLHFLPLLCRCAAAAAFRPPEATATNISHTATRRRRLSFQQQQHQQQQEQEQEQQSQQQQEGVCRLSVLPLISTWRSVARDWGCFSSSRRMLDEGDDVKQLLLQLCVKKREKGPTAEHFLPAMKRLLLCLKRILVLQQQQQQLNDPLDHQASEQQQDKTRDISQEQLISEQHNIDDKDVRGISPLPETGIQAKQVEAAVLIYTTAGAARRLLLMHQQIQHHHMPKKQQQQHQSPQQLTAAARSFYAVPGATLRRRLLLTLPRFSHTRQATTASTYTVCRFDGLYKDSGRWSRRIPHPNDNLRQLQQLLQRSELLYVTAQVQMQNTLACVESLSSLPMKRILDESLFMYASATAAASPFNTPVCSSLTNIPAPAVSVKQSPAVASTDVHPMTDASISRSAITSRPSSSAAGASVYSDFKTPAAAASVCTVPGAAVIAGRNADAASLYQWLIPHIITTCPLSQVAESFVFLSKAAAAAAVYAYIASSHSYLPATPGIRGKEEREIESAAYSQPAAAGAQKQTTQISWNSETKVEAQKEQEYLGEKQQEQQQPQQDEQYKDWKRLWGIVRDLGHHVRQQLHAIRREYQQQCRISEKQQQQFLSTLPQFQQHSREFLLREEDVNWKNFAKLLNTRNSAYELNSSKQVKQILQFMTQDTNRAAATLQSLYCCATRLLPLLCRTSMVYTSQEAEAAVEQEMQPQAIRKLPEVDTSRGREDMKGVDIVVKEDTEGSVSSVSDKHIRSRQSKRKGGGGEGDEEKVDQLLDKEVESRKKKKGEEKEKEGGREEDKGEEEQKEREKRVTLQVQQVQQLAENVARAARHCLYTAVLQEPLQRKRWRGPCQGEVEWAEQQAIAVVAATRDKKKREDLRDHWKEKEELEKKRKKNEEEKDHEKRKEKKEKAEKEKKKKEKQEIKEEQEAGDAAKEDQEQRNSSSVPQKKKKKDNRQLWESVLEEDLWELVEIMRPATGSVAWDLSRQPRACRATPPVYVHHLRHLQKERDNVRRPERNRLAHA